MFSFLRGDNNLRRNDPKQQPNDFYVCSLESEAIDNHKDYDKINNLNNKFYNENDFSDTNDAEDDCETIDNEIYLCFYWLNNRLGSSYYDSNRQIVYYMEDIEEKDNFELIKLLISDLKPYKIIISAKVDESLINYLKVVNESQLVLLPNNDFNYDYSKSRIYEVRLKQTSNLHLNEFNERVIYYSSLLNFESKLMIRSIGALVKYLEKERVNVQLEDSSIQTPIQTFKSMNIDNLLLIDDNALKSLQIFHKITHPSVYKPKCIIINS